MSTSFSRDSRTAVAVGRALVALALVMIGAPAALGVPTGDPPPPYECWLEKELSRLYEEVSPAVVSVVSYRARWEGTGAAGLGAGGMLSYRRLVASGVVVGPHGCVVTTARVAQPGDSIIVHFPRGDRVGARYKGMDPATHIAVLNLSGSGPFPYLPPPAEERGSLPEWVAAVAYGPWKGRYPGRPSLTLSQKGAIGRIETRYGESLGVAWRIRAPFFPGNAGGALVSLSGEWIGLITGAVSGKVGAASSVLGRSHGSSTEAAAQAGLIVPAEIVARAIEEIESGRRATKGFLGVRTARRPRSADRDVGDELGVVVRSVLPDSPAARYGIRPGDLIVGFDGRPVASQGELTRLVLQSRPGQAVRIDIIREKVEFNLTLRVGDSDAVGLYLKDQRELMAERVSIQRELRRLEIQIRLLRKRLERLRIESPGTPAKGTAGSSSDR